MKRRLGLSAAAALLAATGIPASVGAVEENIVEPTRIRFDRFADLSEGHQLITLTGTIYCDEVGTIPIVEFRVRQRATVGSTNETGIIDGACSPEGERFDALVESEELFRRGSARVIQIQYTSLPTGQRIVLRP
jgi:hypothetical protein